MQRSSSYSAKPSCLVFVCLFVLIFACCCSFDEVHFGKFASYYLRGTYYFDVHPPLGTFQPLSTNSLFFCLLLIQKNLGKLLFALVGKLAGFEGHFLFDKIGDDYIANKVPYIMMRGFPALCGALLVPTVFGILYASEHSLAISFLGGLMVVLENSLLTQQRLILLDSFLITFDIFSVFAWIMFYRQRSAPFSVLWWIWLLATGVSISMTTGVKLVGLFVVALIGFSTLHDIWRLIDYKRNLPLPRILNHFFARVIGLIVVPLALYIGFFAIHFAALPRSGPGDTFMSPAFQSTLEGSKMNREAFGLIYGANVTVMHYPTSAFLHSHFHNYPLKYSDDRISSQGQQVTGYPHEDENNLWVFHPEDGKFTEEVDGKDRPRFVRHNDVFRLRHVITDKYLLTHDVASPLTPTHQEVTCVLDSQTDRYKETLFRLLIDNGHDGEQVASIDTRFQIQHLPTKVNIHSHSGKYGEWGFGQQEVNGNKAANDKNNYWIIQNILAPKEDLTRMRDKISSKRPGLMARFLELQTAMLKHNSGLTGSHPYQSYPWSWPILVRGISYWVNNSDRQIYLLGNPIMWWTCSASILVFCLVITIDLLLTRRGMVPANLVGMKRRIYMTGTFFFAGWAFHYLPFFVMGRALFLHHYLPAVVYAILVFCHLTDLAVRTQSGATRWTVMIAIALVFTYGFYSYLPFTFGFQTEPDWVSSKKLISTWDFSYPAKPQ
jgi:dolichyl-phosphate-mannose-protein mannosyltransferase